MGPNDPIFGAKLFSLSKHLEQLIRVLDWVMYVRRERRCAGAAGIVGRYLSGFLCLPSMARVMICEGLFSYMVGAGSDKVSCFF